MAKITTATLQKKRHDGEKITALTAFDAPTARLLDKAGIDIILIGDSLGNTFAGNENSLGVTLEHIIYHTQAVKRATSNAMILADMPFMSYQVSAQEAVKNAGRLIKEGQAEAVKIEVNPSQLHHLEAVINAGIPVMAHIGFTPQAIHQIGGYKIQGKGEADAQKILDLALKLEAIGCFCVLLEMVPSSLSQKITKTLKIPTIGIGAGPHCSGQILVTHDVLGFSGQFTPKFVKKYQEIETLTAAAFDAFVSDVKTQAFPEEKHSY
jgi:3-methyl-2-oxobutanoate hydroxymethyltransferase